jgi:hypothetical protein
MFISNPGPATTTGAGAIGTVTPTPTGPKGTQLDAGNASAAVTTNSLNLEAIDLLLRPPVADGGKIIARAPAQR